VELLKKIFSWPLAAVIITAACGHPPPITIDDADSDCAWNQGGGGSNRTSFSPSKSSYINDLLWTSSFKRRLTVEPTSAYNKILIPATDGKLYVVSAADGSRVDEKKYKEPVVAPVLLSDSLAVLLVEGEKLIVENWLIHKTLWQTDLGDSFIEPLLMNGNIYWIDGKNILRCHRLADGVRIWDSKLKGHFSFTMTGSPEGIYVTPDDGVINCYGANSGQLKWIHETGDRMRNPPVVVGEFLVYCCSDGRLGKLRVSDGSMAWEINLKKPVIAPVASDGEGIFVGTNDRYIYRLDFESGNIEWKRKIGGPIKAGPTLTDKLAVFVSIDYRAYFADKINGDIVYKFKTGGMLTTRPLVCDGKVYIAGEDRKLYCFGISGEE
jgi:outer membrane protein assembly factor BamB